MRRSKTIYIPQLEATHNDEDNYDKVASDLDSGSISAESDLADSPAGQTIRSSYQSPIFGDQNPLVQTLLFGNPGSDK